MELAGVAGSVEEFCERVRSGLANATFEQRRELVKLLVDRIIVTDEEVEIRYVIPTSSESEHVRFCHLRLDYLRDHLLDRPRVEVPAVTREDGQQHLLLFPEMEARVILPETQERPSDLRCSLAGGRPAQTPGLH